MSTDPQNHRAIYDQVVAAGPAGTTVGAIRLALTGDWRLPAKAGPERQLLATRLVMLERRGCIRRGPVILCPASRRLSFSYVLAGPFVDCAGRLPQVRNNQHTKGRRSGGEPKHVEIPRHLEADVDRLRKRFAPVVPIGRDRYLCGHLEVDGPTLAALARGEVSVVEVMGL